MKQSFIFENEGGLQITIAETPEDKKLCDLLVVQHHSYVASAKTVGRCIKYMIWYDGEMVGTFWLGSGFKPTPKPLLNFLGMSQKTFDPLFNTVADNKRFCMAKRLPNLGSQILKNIRMRSATDWKNRYGDDLKLIITTIGGEKSGAVYRADNWTVIGETSGLPADRKSVSMKWNDSEMIASRFVKPTGVDKKTILVTDRLG